MKLELLKLATEWAKILGAILVFGWGIRSKVNAIPL